MLVFGAQTKLVCGMQIKPVYRVCTKLVYGMQIKPVCGAQTKQVYGVRTKPSYMAPIIRESSTDKPND